jgi:hypothetical protein
MSTTSLRALAVTVAAIIAVLTGVATGLLSGSQTCSVTQVQQTPTAAPTSAAAPATTATSPATGSGLGDAERAGGSPTPGAAKPAPPPAVQAAPQTLTCTTGTFAMKPALTAFLGAAFLGGALLLLLLMAGRAQPAPNQARHAPNRTGAAAPAPAPGAARAEADRTALVQAIIYVRDRVTSKALSDRLGAALRDAGVDTLEPTGVRFDPAHHEAGGSAPATDPGKIGSIAAVEVPGYADRGGRVLRAPVVTVYQGTPGTPPARDRTRREQQR